MDQLEQKIMGLRDLAKQLRDTEALLDKLGFVSWDAIMKAEYAFYREVSEKLEEAVWYKYRQAEGLI